jgi:hypothetical protein
MDLKFFENDIFGQFFNININKIVWIFFNIKEYFPKSSQKVGRCGLCYHVCTLDLFGCFICNKKIGFIAIVSWECARRKWWSLYS